MICSMTTANAIVNQDRYWSVLTGGQMIPPVKTDDVGYTFSLVAGY